MRIQVVSICAGLMFKASQTGGKKRRLKLEGVREERGEGSKDINSSTLKHIQSLGHTAFLLICAYLPIAYPSFSKVKEGLTEAII